MNKKRLLELADHIERLPPYQDSILNRKITPSLDAMKQGHYVESGLPLYFSIGDWANICLLYTSPSPRDRQKSRMPSSA